MKIKNKYSIIFFINGLGLGNSTRCYAIIEELKKINKNTKIIVATSGNGYWFFKNRKHIDLLYKFDQITYKKKAGKLSAMMTVLSFGKTLKTLNLNTSKALSLIEKYQPKTVIADSFYFFPKILKKKTFKFISINNSDYIFEKFFKTKSKPLSIYPQFFLIELFDYLYNIIFHDFILSPNLINKPKYFKKNIYRIPPLIRTKLKINNLKIFKPVIMLSGSSFSTQINEKNYQVSEFKKLSIIGRYKKNKINKTFNYLGKLKNNIDVINKYNAAIINAGFSALSEIYLLKKPSVIVPVPNHSEQYLNAKRLEHLGVAIFSKEKDIFKNLLILKKNFYRYRKKFSKIEVINGSILAAKFIMNRRN